MLKLSFQRVLTLACAAAGLLVVSACSADLPQQRLSYEQSQEAFDRHGDTAGMRAAILFSNNTKEDEASILAAEASSKVHVTRLHRVTVYDYPMGRRAAPKDADGNDLAILDAVPKHRGWVAEMGSVARGLVEVVFYDDEFSPMAFMSSEGILTLGHGSARHTLDRRVTIPTAAELVYNAQSRLGVKAWDEDIARIAQLTDNNDLKDKYNVELREPDARLVNQPRRVELTSADPKDFLDLIRK